MTSLSSFNWIYPVAALLNGVGMANLDMAKVKNLKAIPCLMFVTFATTFVIILVRNTLSQYYIDLADTGSSAYTFVFVLSTICDFTTTLCYESFYIVRFRAFVVNDRKHKWLWCMLTIPTLYSAANIIAI
jgi:hypothetical protein